MTELRQLLTILFALGFATCIYGAFFARGFKATALRLGGLCMVAALAVGRVLTWVTAHAFLATILAMIGIAILLLALAIGAYLRRRAERRYWRDLDRFMRRRL